jgi:cytochrome c oxidase cbb3-type subunit 2
MNFHVNHRLLLAIAGLSYAGLTLMIAIVPAFQIQSVLPLPKAHKLSKAELRGRAIYMQEGCGYCHTQFVRNLPMDRPYGRPSVAGDYARERPPLLGTQRTGPDLSNVAARQPSDVWHLIHLYNPRAVVPQSVMPGYPWYFEVKDKAGDADTVVPVPSEWAPSGNKVIIARQPARDLVQYLLTLRQTELRP